MTETKLYGVSTGDGNNGVSHMFPDYYVRTDDPWLLARAAAYGCWKQGDWGWLSSSMEVDGEAEYTISAFTLDEPDTEHDDEADYSDTPAPFILEVFPVKEEECEDCGLGRRQLAEVCPTCDGTGKVLDNRIDRPVYDSIEALKKF